MDKVLHHGKHQEEKKSTASAEHSDAKHKDGAPEEKQKHGFLHKVHDYIEKDNQMQQNDNIWGNYRGPGH